MSKTCGDRSEPLLACEKRKNGMRKWGKRISAPAGIEPAVSHICSFMRLPSNSTVRILKSMLHKSSNRMRRETGTQIQTLLYGGGNFYPIVVMKLGVKESSCKNIKCGEINFIQVSYSRGNKESHRKTKKEATFSNACKRNRRFRRGHKKRGRPNRLFEFGQFFDSIERGSSSSHIGK